MIALILAASLALPPGKPAGVRQAIHERNAAPLFIGVLAAGGVGAWLLMEAGGTPPSATGTGR